MPPTNKHKENTPNDAIFPDLMSEMQTPGCDLPDVADSSSSRRRSGSGGKRLSGERDSDNFPPHSRLFVVCGRHTAEEELEREFGAFGNVEYCRAIRDKQTNESKGLCYIKFEKASAAASAVENLDGQCLYEHSAPIRVQVADAKGTNGRAGKKLQYSKEPEDTPARSRLFVVCPKEMTETQMTECFSQFEGLEYCKVITDKLTGDSKGFAYVKFNKASSAALAMEAVHESGSIQNMKVKVLIADPKVKKLEQHSVHELPRMMPHQLPHIMPGSPQFGPTAYSMPPGAYYAPPPYMGTTFYPVQEPRLLAICHKSATEEQLKSVFEAISGFESCSLSDSPGNDTTRIGHVSFSSVRAAADARHMLDSTEFPPGWTLSLRFDSEVNGTPPSSPPTQMMWPMSPPHMAYPPHPLMGVAPPQQALGSLFPVCEPRVSFKFAGPPLNSASIEEIFSQFGQIEFYMDSDNSGTVTYATQNAALAAQAALNGQEMHGGALYVMIMQSMPTPVQMPPGQLPGPYHISMSPPGYAMGPMGQMVMQTQFPIEW